MASQARLPPAKRSRPQSGHAGRLLAQDSLMASAFVAATGRIPAKVRWAQGNVAKAGAQL